MHRRSYKKKGRKKKPTRINWNKSTFDSEKKDDVGGRSEVKMKEEREREKKKKDREVKRERELRAFIVLGFPFFFSEQFFVRDEVFE